MVRLVTVCNVICYFRNKIYQTLIVFKGGTYVVFVFRCLLHCCFCVLIFLGDFQCDCFAARAGIVCIHSGPCDTIRFFDISINLTPLCTPMSIADNKVFSCLSWSHITFKWPVTPFTKTLIPSWRSNYIHYKVWDEITYSFFNGATVSVWEWISNFIQHLTGHVITYPCWD